MITAKYVECFRFFIKNTLYPNEVHEDTKLNPVTDYDFVPEEETRRRMEQMGLVFRPATNSFSIYSECIDVGGGTNKVRYGWGDQKLVFGMTLANPGVLKSLLWPDKQSGQVFYFTNKTADAGASADNLHLTVQPTFVAGQDIIDNLPKAFQYLWNGAVNPGNAYLMPTGSLQKILPAETIKQGSNTLLKFNLESLPAGRYSLYINNSEKQNFFVPRALKMSPLFGVLEIFLGASAPDNYRLADDTGILMRRDYLAAVDH